MMNKNSRALLLKGWRDLPTAGIPQSAGSLTAELRRLGKVSVYVLRQGTGTLEKTEACLLNVGDIRNAYVREVLLECAGVKVLYARTVVTITSASRQWAGLKRLNERPLGDLLFQDMKIFRTGFVQRPICTHQLIQFLSSYKHVPQLNYLGARRSLFVRDSARLVLTEAFTDGIAEIYKRTNPLRLEREVSDEYSRD